MKIKCEVECCKYNEYCLCTLDCIEVCNCNKDETKESTMCNSFENISK